MALPPFELGAVQRTVTSALPLVPVTLVGAPGNAAGVTGFEAAEAGPVPTEFRALTVKV
jgi:hypothetical protein